MSRILGIGLMAAAVAIGCGNTTSAPAQADAADAAASDASPATSPPAMTGLAVVNSDFSTTKRYIHPQAQTVLAAMERARVAQSGHKTGHSADSDRLSQVA